MCKCLEEVKKNLEENLPLKHKDFKDKKILEVKFNNEVFYFSGDNDLVVPVTIETSYLNKKGEEKSKKIKLNLTPDYCLFCGESKKKEDTDSE